MDPILVEVLANRLASIVNEQQAALVRTAFSTVVRESEDLACGAFDARGRMVAQSLTGNRAHQLDGDGRAPLPRRLPARDAAARRRPPHQRPWQTSGQINDITVVTPVFAGGQVVAFFANTCHTADIGGRILSAESNEIFEEGLRLPIMKLFDGGTPNETLLAIVRANVRTPDETVGDLYAQSACNDVGARSLVHLLDEFGLDSIDSLSEEIISRSDRAMRAAIRALPGRNVRVRELERRIRRADSPSGRDHRGRRRADGRFRRLLAAEPVRDQPRPQLHARVCELCDQGRTRAGRAP